MEQVPLTSITGGREDLLLHFSLSVIVPIRNERAALPELIHRLSRVQSFFSGFEVIFVDDDSQDGTIDFLQNSLPSWARFIIRYDARGMGSAVLEGMAEARHDWIAVIDGDLGVPPESLPRLCAELVATNADLVLGARPFKIESGWLLGVNSRASRFATKAFTKINDPLTNCFVVRREAYREIGYSFSESCHKPALEFAVKLGQKRIAEIELPITSRPRKSKALKKQWDFFRHLRHLANHKFGNWSFFLQFGLVGLTGSAVHLGFLTLFNSWGMNLHAAVAGSIGIAMTSNFLINRFVTFNYAKSKNIFLQYISFCLSCSLGAVLNYSATMILISQFSVLETYPQVAAVGGIIAGMISNFILMRYYVFKKSKLIQPASS